MPLVDPEIFQTLGLAVSDPKTYSSGTERQKLRAAFDLASSQITKQVFGFEAETRMMRRSRLNQEQTIPPQYSDLIAALKKALAGSEPLDKAGGYDDDAKEMTKFICGVLSKLVKAIERFQ